MIRILQITDSHIIGEKDSMFLGMNVLESFRAVIAEVKKDIQKVKSDLIVFSGDLSQDQTELSYQYIVKEIADLPIEIAWTSGNHDDPNVGEKILSLSANISKGKVFVFDDWKIIVLNSHYAEHDSGFLDSEELGFLEQNLQSNNKNIIIFLHHHVVETGSPWLDELRVENYSELLTILKKYENIKIVACGHVHQENFLKKSGITFVSTPSTSVQFKKGEHFELDALMPGYRWFNLYDDGKFDMGVVRVKDNKSLMPDLTVTGY